MSSVYRYTDVPEGVAAAEVFRQSISNSQVLLILAAVRGSGNCLVVFVRARNCWLAPTPLPAPLQADATVQPLAFLSDTIFTLLVTIGLRVHIFYLQASAAFDEVSILREQQLLDCKPRIKVYGLHVQSGCCYVLAECANRLDIFESVNDKATLKGTVDLDSSIKAVGNCGRRIYILDCRRELYVFNANDELGVVERVSSFAEQCPMRNPFMAQFCFYGPYVLALYPTRSPNQLLQFYDVLERSWLREEEFLTTSSRPFGLACLGTGEVLYCIGKHSYQIRSFFIQPPSLVDIAQRRVHQHLPAATDRKLAKTNIMNTLELVHFLCTYRKKQRVPRAVIRILKYLLALR